MTLTADPDLSISTSSSTIMADPTDTTTSSPPKVLPKCRGFHVNFGYYLGGSALQRDYKLSDPIDAYSFASQLRNLKTLPGIEQSLLDRRNDATTPKFNGSVATSPTATAELDQKAFLRRVKDTVQVYGFHSFFYLPDPNDATAMLYLPESIHHFSVQDVIDEHSSRLTLEPSPIYTDSSKTIETSASIKARFRVYDDFEIQDIALSRLAIESLVSPAFRLKVATRYEHHPKFLKYPGSVYLSMVLEVANVSLTHDIGAAEVSFRALRLSSYPGENVSDMANDALKYIRVMQSGYALPVDLSSVLLNQVANSQSAYFNRTCYNALDQVRVMEKSCGRDKDPRLITSHTLYPKYGPVGICAFLQEEYGDLVKTHQWPALQSRPQGNLSSMDGSGRVGGVGNETKTPTPDPKDSAKSGTPSGGAGNPGGGDGPPKIRQRDVWRYSHPADENHTFTNAEGKKYFFCAKCVCKRTGLVGFYNSTHLTSEHGQKKKKLDVPSGSDPAPAPSTDTSGGGSNPSGNHSPVLDENHVDTDPPNGLSFEGAFLADVEDVGVWVAAVSIVEPYSNDSSFIDVVDDISVVDVWMASDNEALDTSNDDVDVSIITDWSPPPRVTRVNPPSPPQVYHSYDASMFGLPRLPHLTVPEAESLISRTIEEGVLPQFYDRNFVVADYALRVAEINHYNPHFYDPTKTDLQVDLAVWKDALEDYDRIRNVFGRLHRYRARNGQLPLDASHWNTHDWITPDDDLLADASSGLYEHTSYCQVCGLNGCTGTRCSLCGGLYEFELFPPDAFYNSSHSSDSSHEDTTAQDNTKTSINPYPLLRIEYHPSSSSDDIFYDCSSFLDGDSSIICDSPFFFDCDTFSDPPSSSLQQSSSIWNTLLSSITCFILFTMMLFWDTLDLYFHGPCHPRLPHRRLRRSKRIHSLRAFPRRWVIFSCFMLFGSNHVVHPISAFTFQVSSTWHRAGSVHDLSVVDFHTLRSYAGFRHAKLFPHHFDVESFASSSVDPINVNEFFDCFSESDDFGLDLWFDCSDPSLHEVEEHFFQAASSVAEMEGDIIAFDYFDVNEPPPPTFMDKFINLEGALLEEVIFDSSNHEISESEAITCNMSALMAEQLDQPLNFTASVEQPFQVIFDTGASLAISPFAEDFIEPVTPLPTDRKLGGMANGLNIAGVGLIKWCFKSNNKLIVTIPALN